MAITIGQITTGLVEPGRSWSGSVITYSFPGAGAAWPSYAADEEQSIGYSGLNAGQQAAFRSAVATWDRLIAPSFAEVGDPGQIRIAFTGHAEIADAAAYALPPPLTGQSPAPWQGDIWINNRHVAEGFPPGAGAYATLIHEVGHALGLKHPFEAPGLPAGYDLKRFTVMSYTLPNDSVAVTMRETASTIQGVMTPVYSTTPMVLDIAAIQSIYGADPTTATGDDRYTFSEADPFLRAIYDAGGVDTLDLSNFTRGSNVDLAPGAYSSVGYFSLEAQQAALIARYPYAPDYVSELFAGVPGSFSGLGVYTWSDNVGIAYSTVIENVTGGSGSDTLTGNGAANGILGAAGDDSIRGLDGDDWMDAGPGADDINGNVGRDVVHGGAGADFVRGGRDADTVYGDDGDDFHVNGNIGEDLVYGGLGSDTVYGGQGQDTLYGEDGADLLSGDLGDDALFGGAGADRFAQRAGGGVDWVGDFNPSEGDRIQLTPGQAYSVVASGGQAVLDLGAGGQLGLAGIAPAAFSAGWVIFA